MTNPLASMPKQVTIVEVGPRDGLQNEAAPVSTGDKVRFCDLLSDAGVPVLEATSFVSPKHVPQMADAGEVFRRIRKDPGRTYLVLVPNERGLDRAIEAGVRAIAVFTAASEAFAKANIRMTIDESVAGFAGVVKRAKADGMWVRAAISTAFGCPFQGEVPVADVVRVSQKLLDLGVDELSVADTIGVGTPNQVYELVDALRDLVPPEKLGLHFHDTRGTALANTLAALSCGVRIFDTSAGGLGGCPFAPGATGNCATEDLVYMLHGMGIQTGIDLTKLRAASRFIAERLGRPHASRAYTALEAADARTSDLTATGS
ncbi:MAG TPA: hydroxymethylglutaryl-CoA lyase [Candidatus Elarobacter sp.]|jgi:isopropylmalate/homocitrate/citramalate synthase|nr:hydroxymethylglutaryl-CoA lyase [Candidatus Elarobacter sp.]